MRRLVNAEAFGLKRLLFSAAAFVVRLGPMISVCFVLIPLTTAQAQHTKYEAAFEGAIGGQASVAGEEKSTRGFFSSPLIWRGRFAFTTTGVQSLSLFIERVNETRRYTDLYSTDAIPFDRSELTESVGMTTVGLEFIRTMISESGFRLGFGFGLGYGMGAADLKIERKSPDRLWNLESCQTWHGLIAIGLIRARYTIYADGMRDVGLVATGRYWGFPSIGPIGECADAYNGPEFRSLHQLGYLAGVSVGF